MDWFNQLSPDTRHALIAVACGAAAVLVLSIIARRLRRWLFILIIGLTVTIAWWWSSVHGVITQVESLFSGR